MPPLTATTRPDLKDVHAFTFGLASRIDRAAARAPFIGEAPVRRLSRTEYGNALRDLFGVDLPFAADMPADGLVGGFDNIGDALSFSPMLLESYLKLSRHALDEALGVDDPEPVTTEYRVERSQAGWIGPGAPFSTRGGVIARHHVTRESAYEIKAYVNDNGLTPIEGVRLFRHRIRLSAGNHNIVAVFPLERAAREGAVPDIEGPGGRPPGGPLDPQGSAIKQRLMLLVDGKPVRLFDIPGATPSAAAFGLRNGPPVLQRLEVEGPFDGSPGTAQPTMGTVFVCQPRTQTEEAACATRIITAFARRAFRRDVTPTEMQPLLKAFDQARIAQPFRSAVTASLRQVLVSPQFLLKLELDSARHAPGKIRKLTGFELASRLSFFLWSSIPDERLLDMAARRKLQSRAAVKREVRRMLANRRADALVDNFAIQWLGLRGLQKAKPDLRMYPQFDDSLRQHLMEETRLFLAYIFRENRPITELLDANYTYLNDRLATLYAIDGVRGAAFRRVYFDRQSPRGGILGQGSILLLTSHADKTAPVLRGKWVLDNLLNSAPPPPPANVPALNTDPGERGRKLTLREQVERHRASPQCSSCHVRMDPIGFSLENFDVIGRWRARSDGLPIDATAQMPDGHQFTGPQGLRQVLLANREQFVAATVSRMMAYALGRRLDARDQPTIRKIVLQARANNYRIHDLILAIATSEPFLKKLEGST